MGIKDWLYERLFLPSWAREMISTYRRERMVNNVAYRYSPESNTLYLVVELKSGKVWSLTCTERGIVVACIDSSLMGDNK